MVGTEALAASAPRLNSAVMLVTGGGGELGSAIASSAAALGARVAVHSLHAVAAEAVASRIRDDGGTAIACAADISDPHQVAALADHVNEALGGVSVLVHCAAHRGTHRPIYEIPPEEWERVVSVTLDGAFLCTRAVVPQMLERGYGRVVYIGGPASTTGRPAGSTHGASAKAGLEGLARSVAQEFGPRGITANVVTPAPLATTRALAAGVEGRLIRRDEAAAFVLLLCYEHARAPNGAVFHLGDSMLT
jgi:NAD(P)-dependent dehydrogenase (short-subunit alcohol dehydrogenase family)